MIHDLALNLGMEEMEWCDMEDNYPENAQIVKFLTLVCLKDKYLTTFADLAKGLRKMELTEHKLCMVKRRKRVKSKCQKRKRCSKLTKGVKKKGNPRPWTAVDTIMEEISVAVSIHTEDEKDHPIMTHLWSSLYVLRKFLLHQKKSKENSCIPDDILDCIPTDEILDKVAPLIGNMVFQLGTELGLSITDIENIKSEIRSGFTSPE
ncbi:unnamed protein product [Mytilus edulis]|uniref:Uncharacterized protein n=1 Tax=Mytilus edulis TaxID=6550 RepID=A0A8S3SR33_MYTED|nr:unnamed protein product [Mytilus edulis]